MTRGGSLAGFAALLVAGLLAGCGGKPAPGGRVVLLALDGADPAVVLELAHRGRLPHLAGLMREGAFGPLRSESPLYSPAIWTTIATGVPRERHGIVHFAALPPPPPEGGPPGRPPRILVNSNFRRVDALWNIVSRYDRSVGFVGWWATWPAEPVRGFIVSDRVAFSRYEEWLPDPSDPAFHLTDPPGLLEEIRDRILSPRDLERARIEEIVPLTGEEWETMHRVARPVEFQWSSIVPFALAEQETYRRIGLDLLARGQPDLFAVFLVAIDPVCHCFWHAFRPEGFEGIDPREIERFRDAVPRAYELADRIVGEFLRAVDPGSTVIVLSDHGFAPGKGRPVEGRYGSGIHSRDGILILRGPGVRHGARLDGAGVLDVAPTVLALLGIPPGRDMPGRVLLDAFEEGRAAALRLGRVATHRGPRGEGTTAPLDAIPGPGERLYLEKLRALGYLR